MRRIFGAVLGTAVALAVGVLVLGAFFVQTPEIEIAGAHLAEYGLIIAAFALLVGLLNVVQVHLRQIRHRAHGWPYSIVLLVTVAILLVLGAPGTAGPNEPAVAFAFEYLLFPLEATVFSLLAFFILAVAYRALRATSWELSLLLLTALLIVVAGTPLASLVPGIAAARGYVMDVPVAAAVRGILLGITLGVIATGLRLLFDGRRYFS